MCNDMMCTCSQPQPFMHWNNVKNICEEWHNFELHVSAFWGGPLHDKEEDVKLNFLKLWLGDEGRKLFEKFEGIFCADDMKNLNFVLRRFKHFCFCKKSEKRFFSELLKDKNYALKNGLGTNSEPPQLESHCETAKLKNVLINFKPIGKNESGLNRFAATESESKYVKKTCHLCGESHSLPLICVDKMKNCCHELQTSCHLKNFSKPRRDVVTGNLIKQGCCSDHEVTTKKKSMASNERGTSELNRLRGVQQATGSSLPRTELPAGVSQIIQTAKVVDSVNDPHYVDIDLRKDNNQLQEKVNFLFEGEKSPDKTSSMQRFPSSNEMDSGFESFGVQNERDASSTRLKTVTEDYNASNIPPNVTNIPTGATNISSCSVNPGVCSNVIPPCAVSNVPPNAASNVPPVTAAAPEPSEQAHFELPNVLDDNTPLNKWPYEIMDILEQDLDNNRPNNWKEFMKKIKISWMEINDFSNRHRKDRMNAMFNEYHILQDYTIGQLKQVLKSIKREKTVERIERVINQHNLG